MLFAATDTGAALKVDCVPSGTVPAVRTTLSLKVPTALPLYCGFTVYAPARVPFRVAV